MDFINMLVLLGVILLVSFITFKFNGYIDIKDNIVDNTVDKIATFFHELSHYLTLKFFGVKVFKFSLKIKMAENGDEILGTVEFENSKRFTQRVGIFLNAIAPLLLLFWVYILTANVNVEGTTILTLPKLLVAIFGLLKGWSLIVTLIMFIFFKFFSGIGTLSNVDLKIARGNVIPFSIYLLGLLILNYVITFLGLQQYLLTHSLIILVAIMVCSVVYNISKNAIFGALFLFILGLYVSPRLFFILNGLAIFTIYYLIATILFILIGLAIKKVKSQSLASNIKDTDIDKVLKNNDFNDTNDFN